MTRGLAQKPEGYRTLAVVPARGGSKGIPRKNLVPLGGRPLIYYTIREACLSQLITRVLVSSDDKEIIRIAREIGAETPFQRPAALSKDSSSSAAVAKHALSFAEREEGLKYHYVVLLQPTAPLRTSDDIDAALTCLWRSDADSIVSLCLVEEPHPTKLQIIKRGIVKPFMPSLWRDGLRRQELRPVYFLNGAIYAVRRDILVKRGTLWGGRTVPYIMPLERSINIDRWIDLKLAEVFLEKGPVKSFKKVTE